MRVTLDSLVDGEVEISGSDFNQKLIKKTAFKDMSRKVLHV